MRVRVCMVTFITAFLQMATIREYFAGKNIFITGATGFLGKVLIEKLLRSCPEINGIYCLIRQKKGKRATDRLNDLFDDKVFPELFVGVS